MTDTHGPGNVTTATDTELIQMAQRGNMEAFETLVRRYDRQVFSIAAGYVTSADDAKDIHQEVFLRVYRGLARFKFRSEFGTWLHRITTNVCLTHRSRLGRDRHLPLDQLIESGSERHPQLHDEATARRMGEDEEITRRVGRALERLSPRQRLVFTLRHLEGHKLSEIGRMLGCSDGTVKKHLFEATARMRTELSDFLPED
jgi:RNA polymerase sigma-70 factor (ECF subfamily)